MKHRQNHTRATAAFVILAGLVLGLVLADQYESPNAIAGDDKIFAPHYCVPLEPGSDRKSLEGEFFREFMSGGSRLICPLVRDIVQGNLDAVWVRVYNLPEPDSDPPECCVHAVSVLGGDSDFACEQADDFQGFQSIEFDLADFEEYDNGHYVVTCDLGFGDLYSIRTSESD